MLTVDYDLLGLTPGDLVLDMGAGAGRHSFECFRRGADLVALDYGFDELPPVREMLAAMLAEGEAPAGNLGACVNGDALRLPFADDTFDRIICSEVFEHIGHDTDAMTELHRVLRPGGVLAATVPAWLPEKICWALSAEYHAPLAPGGHVRIYTEKQLRTRLDAAEFEVRGSHRVHALHSPYWWLRCLVGPTNDTNPLVRAYHELLVWDMVDQPLVTRTAEKLLNPVMGKSVVVYAHKPTEPGGADTSGEARRTSTRRSADQAAVVSRTETTNA
ncbi:MAG: class I SAM-dependent methyltransferase [Microthrixaceae bacterium]|nr:class I SAM-dependent methyltransferase [Microthrixaceae bacterium]